ncbi:MAG: signal peptidase I, partial [Thermoguttaceae bacterium]
LAVLLPVPFAVAAAYLPNPSASLIAFVSVCLFVLAVYFYAIVDSYRLAKRIGEHYELKDYNRGIVYLLFIVASIIHAPAVAMHIRANVLEAFFCPSDSMSPTLQTGDRFLVNKLLQRQLPHRGDAVVFLSPNNRDQRWVKRVIALPGDTVSMQGSDVYVNGKKLEHRHVPISDQTPADSSASEVVCETDGGATYRIQLRADAPMAGTYAETQVPPGHCFVLGDNRDHSEDSRRFGFVPLGDILGKAQYVYWPAKRWSRFGTIDQ